MDLATAIAIARVAHFGQTDKGGADYIEHPLRVMEAVSDEGLDHMLAAVLHDVVEDTSITTGALVAAGLPAHVAEAVDALTRSEGEPYGNFIRRVAKNPIAARVKLADLRDNMDESRLGREPNTKDTSRLIRYQNAVIALTKSMADSPTERT